MNETIATAKIGARQVSAQLTRALIVRAALEELSSSEAATVFSMDAVAKRAGVARMTVFNCYANRSILLNAVCDEMAHSADLLDVTAHMNEPDIRLAFVRYVDCFAQFYAQYAQPLRRLRAFAALDAELGALMKARDAKRTAGLTWLVQRLVGASPLDASSPAVQAVVAQLKALLCLEVYESLASSTTNDAWPRHQLRSMAEAVLAQFKKNTADVCVIWS
jgi:AcrR family transcriptional regulator